jgi:hypothetical protein
MELGDLGLDRDSCSLVAAVVDDAEGGVARAPSVMCLSNLLLTKFGKVEKIRLFDLSNRNIRF